MSKYYYHGMSPRKNPNDRLNTMIEIIKSGGLKSKHLQDNLGFVIGFNGNEYISLCNKENSYMYNFIDDRNNSYEEYIVNNFCFIISDRIDAIKTQDFSKKRSEISYADFYSIAQGDIRYSDMFDEWQVKDEIKLDKIIGIGLPFNLVMSYKNMDKEFKKSIELLYSLARTLNIDIVNTENFNFVEYYEKEKNINDDRHVYYIN